MGLVFSNRPGYITYGFTALEGQHWKILCFRHTAWRKKYRSFPLKVISWIFDALKKHIKRGRNKDFPTTLEIDAFSFKVPLSAVEHIFLKKSWVGINSQMRKNQANIPLLNRFNNEKIFSISTQEAFSLLLQKFNCVWRRIRFHQLTMESCHFGSTRQRLLMIVFDECYW